MYLFILFVSVILTNSLVTSQNEIHKDEGFSKKMLLLKFKYAYARKSGYEKCWVCSKLHPSTAKIPLMAVPINYTDLANSSINIIGTNTSKTVMFKSNGLAFPPDWCFNLGNTTGGNRECQDSKFNLSIVVLNGSFYPSNTSTHQTLSDFLTNIVDNKVRWLVSNLSLYGYTSRYRRNISSSPVALGNNIYICCGDKCYTWIPRRAQGWCYLASLVPVMGVVGDERGDHLLEASMHPRYPLRYRSKREIFLEQDMAWAWFPSWTGWGIDLMKRLNNYTGIINDILEKNSDDITKLNLETRAITKQIELHELAIESMSAALTGLCETTEDYECCTWIHNTSIEVPDYYDIIAQHRTEVKDLQEKARNIGRDWDPFGGTFSFSGLFSWFKKAAMMIIVVLIFIFLIYLCFKLFMCFCKKAKVNAVEKMELL
ncbi:uncharacterized protein LOC143963590 [Lithobates pipiens]